MTKRKVSDEQIIEKLQDPSITSYRQVAQALGTTPSGEFNNTCRQLCKRHGIPEKIQKNGRKPAGGNQVSDTALKFEEIQREDRLMRNGKRLVVIATGDAGFSVRNMMEKIIFVSREDFEKDAAQYIKVPAGDPKAAQAETNKKPAFIRQDFEECFKPIHQVVKDADKSKKSMEDIIHTDSAENVVESAPADTGSVHIDTGIDYTRDPFEPEDYIDTEWGAVEREISDTVLSYRDYLNKIDQLIDLMLPSCSGVYMPMTENVLTIAKDMLDEGFKAEVRDRNKRKEAGV